MLRRFGEDHFAGACAQHGSNGTADFLPNSIISVFNHQHGAVLQVAHALPGLLALAAHGNGKGIAGGNGGLECLAERGQAQGSHSGGFGGADQIAVIGDQGSAGLLAQPQQLMAQERAIINEAYAGDIIGVFDPGIFSIGDTICDKSMKVEFEGIPTFAPEIFAGVERIDTMKRKQFEKGIMQIAQEGAIQIFHEPFTGVEEIIVGVVGVLQLEVLEYRLKNEYGVDVRRRSMPFEVVRWIDNENVNPNDLNLTSDTKWVQDFRGNSLLLFTSEWCVNWALNKNPGLELREFNRD